MSTFSWATECRLAKTCCQHGSIPSSALLHARIRSALGKECRGLSRIYSCRVNSTGKQFMQIHAILKNQEEIQANLNEDAPSPSPPPREMYAKSDFFFLIYFFPPEILLITPSGDRENSPLLILYFWVAIMFSRNRSSNHNHY